MKLMNPSLVPAQDLKFSTKPIFEPLLKKKHQYCDLSFKLRRGICRRDES